MLSNIFCSNKNKAQQICINPNCMAESSYICFKEDDYCHHEHQDCSFLSLTYLRRKVHQIKNKTFDINLQNLLNLHKQATKILHSLQTFLSNYSILSIIKNITNPSGNIDSSHKLTLLQFINSQLKQQPYVEPEKIQKQLSILKDSIDNYLIGLRTSIDVRDNFLIMKKSQIIRSKKVLSSPIKNNNNNNNQYKNSNIQQNKNSNFNQHKNNNLLAQKLYVKPQSGFFNVKSQIIPSKASKIINSFKRSIPKAPYYSQITDKMDIINTFFSNHIVNVKLLYRASQHQYLVSKFHQLCDGIPNTLVLVLTEFQRIIGGFTPLPWSSKGQWHSDPKYETFIFSLSQQQRYPLLNKQKAIWCSKSFGPSFGYPDLQISDKCFYNKKSCVNFPQCFNNSNYKLCPDSINFLCGTTTGCFRILEWQVYQLIF